MQGVAPEAIEWSNFVYPIHHAEHAKLNLKQRQAVQHYAEMIRRLLKKRDQYRSRIASIPRRGLGMTLQPDPDTQDELFELTHSFFEHVYSTISALSSVHGRVRIFSGNEPPVSSVEKFLDWWGKQPSFLFQEESVEILLRARNFRTVLAHPQQHVVFNWGTLSVREDRTVSILLHGESSSTGKIPAGSIADPSGSGRWEFVAPDMSEVAWALLNFTSLTFHAMAGTFPLEPHEETCTWEADGYGSAPYIALAQFMEEEAWLDPAVAHLRPDVET